MHYRSWRICSSLAVQDLRKRLEYLLTEVAAVEPFPRWEPVHEDGAVDIQEHRDPRSSGGDRI
jgi:hypothetical protein